MALLKLYSYISMLNLETSSTSISEYSSIAGCEVGMGCGG